MNPRSRMTNLLRSTKNFGLGFILMLFRLFNHSNNKSIEFRQGLIAFGNRYYLKWNIDRLGWIYIQGHGFYTQQSGQIAISPDVRKKLTVVWISAFSLEKRAYEIDPKKLRSPELGLVNNGFLLDYVVPNSKNLRTLLSLPAELRLNAKVKPLEPSILLPSFKLKRLSNPDLHEIQ